jgi:uncharacterized protein (TIGR02594 family)
MRNWTAKRITDWQIKTFGAEISGEKVLIRSLKEFAELGVAIHNKTGDTKVLDECADCLIFMAGVSGHLGSSAFEDGMSIPSERVAELQHGENPTDEQVFAELMRTIGHLPSMVVSPGNREFYHKIYVAVRYLRQIVLIHNGATDALIDAKMEINAKRSWRVLADGSFQYTPDVGTVSGEGSASSVVKPGTGSVGNVSVQPSSSSTDSMDSFRVDVAKLIFPSTVTDVFKQLVADAFTSPHLKGVSVDVRMAMVAQWALESAYGASSLARSSYNFGGLKWADRLHGIEGIYDSGRKPSDGDRMGTYAGFRFPGAFIAGYLNFLTHGRYSDWNFHTSGRDFISYLRSRGYAEDTQYTAKVMAVKDRIFKGIDSAPETVNLVPATKLPPLKTNFMWLDHALSQVGVKEKPGPNDNPTVVSYYAEVGFPGQHDSVAWCAAFVGAMLKRGGRSCPKTLRARDYERYGVPCEPKQGCVVVMWRGSPEAGTGHVGFYVGGTADYVELISGNTGDMVQRSFFPRDRVTAYRWPV